MRAVIVAFLASTVAFGACADLVARNGKNELRLREGPCVNLKVLEGLRPEFHSQFKSAHAEINGKGLDACWIDTEQGAYYVMFDDGDTAVFPITIFTESGL